MSDIVMLEQTVGNVIITKRKPSNKPSALSDDDEILVVDEVDATQKENSTTLRVTPVKKEEEPVKTEASPRKKPRPPIVKELALRAMSKRENPGGPSKTESGAEPDVLHSNFENAIAQIHPGDMAAELKPLVDCLADQRDDDDNGAAAAGRVGRAEEDPE